jgi:hypothetical protein
MEGEEEAFALFEGFRPKPWHILGRLPLAEAAVRIAIGHAFLWQATR